MFEYVLSVSLSNSQQSINSSEIRALLEQAITVANQSRNSHLKGRIFELVEAPEDDSHARIILKSNTEVIPTRALSSLSRALLTVDTAGIIVPYRNCIFNATLVDNQKTIITNISDVEMMQELTAMIFGQTLINSNKDKKLSRDYIEKIRDLVIDYLNKKSVE